MDPVHEKARQVKLIILDVDGVLTDGSLFFDNQGGEYKAFNAKDGHGMRMVMDGGIKLAIITARQSELLLHRADNLSVPRELIYQGYRDKRQAFAELCQQTGIQPQQMAYVGDDVIDLPVMSRVGLAIAVADAHPFVKKQADWVTENAGGRGAVREACEMLLETQGKLADMLTAYLQ